MAITFLTAVVHTTSNIESHHFRTQRHTQLFNGSLSGTTTPRWASTRRNSHPLTYLDIHRQTGAIRQSCLPAGVTHALAGAVGDMNTGAGI